MPNTYSPQAHARSAKSALTNALRLVEPICADQSYEDICRQTDAALGELAYSIKALQRTRAAAQADLRPARVLERTQ